MATYERSCGEFDKRLDAAERDLVRCGALGEKVEELKTSVRDTERYYRGYIVPLLERSNELQADRRGQPAPAARPAP